MNRLAIPSVLAAVLAAAGAVHADHDQDYLPLKKGNEWTYCRANPLIKFAPWTNKVDQKYQTAFHVDAFPGFPSGAWLAWSGNTLYAWSWEKYSWVAFLRFGAPTGTTYSVSIDDSLWNNTQVTLKSKSLKVYNPYLNVHHGYVAHFTFAHPSLADAGVQEYMFDEGYGLVFWSSQSIAGPTTGWLGAGKVNGRKFGPITFETLQSGNISGYPVAGTNLVKLVNTKADWLALWAQHSPGSQAPSVDFSKHTVVAIFAGQRNTGGFTVQLSSAWWNFPSNSSARLKITETTPAGPVILMLTKPFSFAVLDAKVTSAQYDWQVIYNR